MSIAEIVRNCLPEIVGDWSTWVPAAHISRQDWQEAVECVVLGLRRAFNQPAFGLSPAEVSIYYHQPLGDLVEEMRSRLA